MIPPFGGTEARSSARGVALAACGAGLLALLLGPGALWARTAPPEAAQEPVPSDSEPDSTPEPEVVEAFLRLKFDEARLHFREGRFEKALQIADAILTLAPEVSFRASAQKLRREAEARVLGLSVLSARFELGEPEAPEFPLRRIAGSLVLENLTDGVLQLRISRRQKILGRTHYRARDFFDDGTQRVYQGTPMVRADHDLRLPPGETRILDLEVEVPAATGRAPCLQVVDVGGIVRPQEIRVGEKPPITRPIPWQTERFFLLPPDLSDVEQDPYRSLQLGALTVDPRRLVAAGWVWLLENEEDRPGRQRVTDLLVDTLLRDEVALRKPVIQLLGAYTGLELPPTPEAWKTWALQRQSVSSRSSEG